MISAVILIYNEEEIISILHERVSQAMSKVGEWEVVYVNDGSKDASLELAAATSGGRSSCGCR